MARTIFTMAFLAVLAGFAAPLAFRLGGARKRPLPDRFPLREQFVELNGGASRLAGRRFVNSVYRTKRGMLLSDLPRYFDIDALTDVADRVANFSRWLDGKGIAYVYVQAPGKIDMKGTMLPSVFRHDGNKLADAFLAALGRNEVNVIDLREKLTATEEDVMSHFYRGDHHWNNDAVFEVFVDLAPRLADAAGADSAAVESVASPRSWKRKVWRRCFMGTKARRTGRLFGGLDDLVVYTPKFRTKMKVEIPSKKVKLAGNFRKTVMWNADRILETRGDEFRVDAYSFLYVGGMYGVVRFKNVDAPVKKRLVIVGDSYSRPLQGFLSTVFSEVLALDQRRFRPGQTVVGFVEQFKPDVVLQLANVGAVGASRDVDGPGLKSSDIFVYGDPR